MTKYRMTLRSKQKKTINNFLKLFDPTNNETHNLQLILNSVKKKKKKKNKIAVLKSPHVNKKAQKHFQLITYITTLKLFLGDTKKNMILLKKIKNQLFPDLDIKIEKKFSGKESQITNISLSPDKIANYTDINLLVKQQTHDETFYKKIKTKNLLKNTLTYLKNLDIYGHLEKKKTNN